MAITIHHATAKKAAKAGIILKVEDNDIVAYYNHRELASGPVANKVLEAAMARQSEMPQSKPSAPKKLFNESAADARPAIPQGKIAALEDEGEQDNDEGRSIIKKKYKDKYRSHHMTNGDDFATEVAAYCNRIEDGIPRCDEVVLIKFAKANGCWDPNYAPLNIGMKRMNIGNRLRGKVKHGHVVVWPAKEGK